MLRYRLSPSVTMRRLPLADANVGRALVFDLRKISTLAAVQSDSGMLVAVDSEGRVAPRCDNWKCLTWE